MSALIGECLFTIPQPSWRLGYSSDLSRYRRAFMQRTGQRRYARGVVLLLALLMMALATLAATATLERLLIQTRAVAGEVDGIRAFHAADGGLQLCEQRYLHGALPARTWRRPGAPARWREAGVFDDVGNRWPARTAVASALIAEWPGAAAPPRCLVETWRPHGENRLGALITSMGVGADRHTERWVQSWLLPEGELTHHAWRSVANPP